MENFLKTNIWLTVFSGLFSLSVFSLGFEDFEGEDLFLKCSSTNQTYFFEKAATNENRGSDPFVLVTTKESMEVLPVWAGSETFTIGELLVTDYSYEIDRFSGSLAKKERTRKTRKEFSKKCKKNHS